MKKSIIIMAVIFLYNFSVAQETRMQERTTEQNTTPDPKEFGTEETETEEQEPMVLETSPQEMEERDTIVQEVIPQQPKPQEPQVVKTKTEEMKKHDHSDRHLGFYISPLSVGYTHWTSNYFTENQNHELRGNGVYFGPTASLVFILGRLRLGANGAFQSIAINNARPDDGISRDVFRQSGNRRHIVRYGGTVQLNLLPERSRIGILPTFSAGSYRFVKDDFAERDNVRNRYFGSAGLMFEYKMDHLSLFVEPNYSGYKYRLNNLPDERKSYLHTVGGNIGVGFRL